MLSAEAFNAMLNEMGQSVDWSRAYDCPCRDEYSGAARPDCPVCRGKGVTWGTATAGIAAIAGQKVQQAWARMGLYEHGDMVMTLPSDSPLYAMGQFDRMVMTNSSVPFSRTMIRTGAEKLPIHIHQVDRVFWLVNDAIVEGGIPAAAADGAMTWTTGEPPAGAQYSITGRRRPEYFLFHDYPQDRAHFGGQTLPRRVVARVMDLFGR